ncbi:MAG TPA: hypothetical protein VHV54_04585 [Candidatus Binatia bacterium]|nr:hypothetical protein [Candidatus Binatia bacterium]
MKSQSSFSLSWLKDEVAQGIVAFEMNPLRYKFLAGELLRAFPRRQARGAISNTRLLTPTEAVATMTGKFFRRQKYHITKTSQRILLPIVEKMSETFPRKYHEVNF